MAGLVGVVALPDPDVWRGRRVLVTGHTGFKGAWLALWLELLGARVSGVALDHPDPKAAFRALHPQLEVDARADIRDSSALADVFEQAAPEVVFHLAAQSLVLEGYRDPVGTYETNVLGTVNILSEAATTGVSAVVVVTTDKVYANDERGTPFAESDPLGCHDPYSTSKACADLIAQGWAADHMNIAIGRAGNVIGGGDVSADRLLPDARRAVLRGAPLILRHPDSVRPWQFVLDPLHGYLRQAEGLLSGAKLPAALNFGPAVDGCWSARRLTSTAFDAYGAGEWAEDKAVRPPEANVLRLDASLARTCLRWHPRVPVATAVAYTVAWWRAEDLGQDLRELAIAQIESHFAPQR